MANAKRDQNYVPTMIATSNADGTTPITLYADPVTHRLLVALSGSLDTLSDVVITSEAQGDLLYFNGTNWVNLGHGTDGQFLKTKGADANPEWATMSAAPADQGVTNGNTHDHVGGDGAQIDHTGLANIGTNAHSVIDTFIASKAGANGLASLSASSLVVQNPANATATATGSKIPISDASA